MNNLLHNSNYYYFKVLRSYEQLDKTTEYILFSVMVAEGLTQFSVFADSLHIDIGGTVSRWSPCDNSCVKPSNAEKINSLAFAQRMVLDRMFKRLSSDVKHLRTVHNDICIGMQYEEEEKIAAAAQAAKALLHSF